VKTDYVEGAVTFTVEQPRECYRCPVCGSDDVLGRGQNTRRFRTVSIGGKPAYVVLAVLAVVADPKPDQPFRPVPRQCAVVQANPG